MPDTGNAPKAETDTGTPAPATDGSAAGDAPTPSVLSRKELDDYRESLRRRFHSI
jgi:hypothetical protein